MHFCIKHVSKQRADNQGTWLSFHSFLWFSLVFLFFAADWLNAVKAFLIISIILYLMVIIYLIMMVWGRGLAIRYIGVDLLFAGKHDSFNLQSLPKMLEHLLSPELQHPLPEKNLHAVSMDKGRYLSDLKNQHCSRGRGLLAYLRTEPWKSYKAQGVLITFGNDL